MAQPSRGDAAKRFLIASVVLSATLPAAATYAQSSGQWETGQELYDKVCGYCHDPEVGVGTVLAGRELPEVYLRGIVRSGLNAMPAFPASFVDDESIALLAEYLATLPAPAAAEP